MSSMPSGMEAYCVDSGPVVGRGILFDQLELDQMVDGSVKDILLDVTGIEELRELLAGVVNTDFEREGLEQLLSLNDTPPKDWLVGEAIAEAYVAEHCSCFFPWPTNRDLKNPTASPAGCDLTGFQIVADEVMPARFAFGEVKTSIQKASPPSVMNSLRGQMTGLRDTETVKKHLVLYLGRHAKNTDWSPLYRSAAKRYFLSSDDVAVYGILIRDILPNSLDLSACVNAMAQDCPLKTDISVYALYLPEESIASLPTLVTGSANDEGG